MLPNRYLKEPRIENQQVQSSTCNKETAIEDGSASELYVEVVIITQHIESYCEERV